MSTIDAVPASGYAGDITPAQAWELLSGTPGAVLVDVRTQGEWDTIGVPDLTGIGKEAVFTQWVLGNGTPNPTFLTDLKAALDDDATSIVFLCRSGQRSIGAARLATEAGLPPSYNVLQGFEGAPGLSGARDVNGWKVAGLPWAVPGSEVTASGGVTASSGITASDDAATR